MIEGHDYNFRVKAVNKFGESMPLAMSSPITAKDPFGKPDKPGAPEPTGMIHQSSWLVVFIYIKWLIRVSS